LPSDDSPGAKRERESAKRTGTRTSEAARHKVVLTYTPEYSGKFQRVAETCQELSDRQEKVLIFSQFREIIGALADLRCVSHHSLRKGKIIKTAFSQSSSSRSHVHDTFLSPASGDWQGRPISSRS
jgi:hypothetical protein